MAQPLGFNNTYAILVRRQDARTLDLRTIVPVLGITQILAWGSSYYLLAVLAEPIAGDTGWSLAWIVGGLSLGLLVAGVVSPREADHRGRKYPRAVEPK